MQFINEKFYFKASRGELSKKDPKERRVKRRGNSTYWLLGKTETKMEMGDVHLYRNRTGGKRFQNMPLFFWTTIENRMQGIACLLVNNTAWRKRDATCNRHKHKYQNCVLHLQGSAKEWSLGCVIPASWPPLAAGARFTHPRDHSLADPCIRILWTSNEMST